MAALRKWRLACLLGLFLCGLAPYAASYLIYYPDERHYTDAALVMLNNGDYLTPHGADGEPRFKKPPLAYWLVAASFRAFGVNPLAGRLPFLAAAALTGWLTFRLAARLTRSPAAAWMAALIILSHPVLMLSAVRTMPDVLLCLFMLLSASGFLRLIVLREHHLGNYLAAYLGAGLAVASKGLLPLLFVLYAWLFVLLRRPEDCPWQSLVHVPAMLTGALVGGGWFALMFLLHGSLGLAEFWTDQVAYNLPAWTAASAAALPFKALSFCSFYFLTFLPWSAIAAVGNRGFRTSSSATLSETTGFIIPWCLALAVIFAFGRNLSIRYLLPAAPLGAILLADFLTRASQRPPTPTLDPRAEPPTGCHPSSLPGQTSPRPPTRPSRRAVPSLAATCFHLLAGVAAALGLGLAALVVAAGSAGFGIVALSVWWLILCGLAWLIARQRLNPFVGLAALPLLTVLAGFFLARPLFLPDLATQIASCIRASDLAPGQSVALVGTENLAARVRVASGAKVRIERFASARDAAESQCAGFVVPAGGHLELPLDGGAKPLLVRGFAEAPKVNWSWLAGRRDIAGLLESSKQTYVVFLPKRSLARGRPPPVK